MATIIKVNGQTITIANKSEEAFNMDKEFASIESIGIDVAGSLKVLDIVSNTKAIESFGYKSTEDLKEKIKQTATAIFDKIVEWLGKLWGFIQKIGGFFKKIFVRKPNMDFVSKVSEVFKKKQPEEADKLKEEESKVVNAYQKQSKISELIKKVFPRSIEAVKSATKGNSVEEEHKTLVDVVEKAKEIKDQTVETGLLAASKVIPTNIIDTTYKVLDETSKELKITNQTVDSCKNVGNDIAANVASKTTQAISEVTGASKEVVAAISAYIAHVDSLVKKSSGGKVSIYDIKTHEDFENFMNSNDTLVF